MNCPGCDAMRMHLLKIPPHKASCRERIATAMAQDDEGRAMKMAIGDWSNDEYRRFAAMKWNL